MNKSLLFLTAVIFAANAQAHFVSDLFNGKVSLYSDKAEQELVKPSYVEAAKNKFNAALDYVITSRPAQFIADNAKAFVASKAVTKGLEFAKNNKKALAAVVGVTAVATAAGLAYKYDKLPAMPKFSNSKAKTVKAEVKPAQDAQKVETPVVSTNAAKIAELKAQQEKAKKQKRYNLEITLAKEIKALEAAVAK